MNSSSGWFAIICPIFFCWLHLSVAWSLILSWIVSVLFYSIPVYYFLKWRRDTTARNLARKAAATEGEGKMVEMVEMDVAKTEEEDQKIDDNSNGNDNNNNNSNNNNNNSNSNENYFRENVIAPPSNSSGASFMVNSTPSASVIVTDAEDKPNSLNVL